MNWFNDGVLWGWEQRSLRILFVQIHPGVENLIRTRDILMCNNTLPTPGRSMCVTVHTHVWDDCLKHCKTDPVPKGCSAKGIQCQYWGCGEGKGLENPISQKGSIKLHI